MPLRAKDFTLKTLGYARSLLLREDVCLAKDNDQAIKNLIEKLAIEDKPISEAVILANTINNPRIKTTELYKCALKNGLLLKDALEIFDSIPTQKKPFQALFVLLELAKNNIANIFFMLVHVSMIMPEHQRIIIGNVYTERIK